MKLAIIICREVTKICATTGCMKAFNERTGTFSQYGEEPLTLSALATCLGCEDAEKEGSPEFSARLDSLKKSSVENIHLGICTSEKYCKHTKKLMDTIKAHGFTVSMGTHK